MNDTTRARRKSTISYWLLIAAQWLLLMLAIAGGMTRSANALRDYVSPSLGDGWLTAGAFLAGLLLGLTVISPKALFPLKVWADCRTCPSADACMEIAVVREVELYL